MSSVQLDLKLIADDASIKKALNRAAKDLDRTGKQAKKTKKEVSGLGKSFTQAANNVAIFNGQLDPISGRLSAIGTGIKRFGIANIAMGVGITATVYAVSKLIGALEIYEQRQNKFEGLLRATGYAARLTRNDLESLAQTTARSTLGDVAGTSEAINALLTFRKVQGDVFKETIKLAVDAKVVFGGNLREGVVAFGKALNDPIANLGALSRKGIQFINTQKQMIKTMWEAGDAVGAQNIILQEMRGQFGGLAEIEASALAAATDSLGQSWDNFMESIGQTAPIVFIRNAITGLVMATDDLIQLTSSFHDENKAELNRINELEAIQLDKAEKLNKAKKLHNELVASGATSLKAIAVDVAQADYDRATKNFQDFINKKKEIQEKQRIIQAKGAVKSLVGELEDVTSKNKELVKVFEQRRISLISGFEDEKDKATRVHEQKTQAIQVAYDNQITSQQSFVKKEQELFLQSKKSNKIYYNEKIRQLKVSGGNEEKIAKLKSDLNEKNEELTKHHNNFINNQNDKELISEIEYGITLTESKEGLNKKLSDIDDRRLAKIKADQLRTERALKVAANAARKRAKFFRQLEGVSGKEGKIQERYQARLEQIKVYENNKTLFTEVGEAERAAIFKSYREKAKGLYDDELKEFTDKESAKTLRLQEQAAIRAGREFKKAAQLGMAEQEEGGIQDFFDVNIGEIQAKQEILESLTAEHLQRITDMKISNEEKVARHSEVVRQYAIKQQELEKEGREKAYGDMWGAMNVLASNGSRKAFAISKALNIANVVMNTIDGAMGAYKALAGIPYVGPFLGAAAAATVAAAGAAQVSKIKAQKMPQAHDGIDYVPREGTFLLSQGERVLSPQLNADLTEDLAKRRQKQDEGEQGVNVNLTLPDVAGYSAIEQWYEDNSDRIVAHIQYAMARP